MTRDNGDIKIDKIIRSRRKSISLELKGDGRLIVRAPYSTSRRQIEEWVQTKGSWIRKKQTLVKVQSQEVPPKEFSSGEEFLYLGRTYRLEIVVDQDEPLILKDKFFLAEKFRKEGLPTFEKWYKKRAFEQIKGLVDNRAKENGFAFTRIRITGARTRWGSCSSKGSLNFTWRLVMAPAEVIDYVVVHELTHLKIRNHSKDYWNEVGKLLPDYKQYRKWLKDNGHRLSLD